MVDTPTPEQILEALRNAGWLLEQDSARCLEGHGLRTMMGWAYADLEEPSKSREMDVHGFKEYYRSEDHRLSVSARVLVECKQSANPYVVIGRRQPDDRLNRLPTEHVLPYQQLTTSVESAQGKTQVESAPAWTHLGFHRLPGSPSLEPFRGSQMTRLDRGKVWTADNRGIFTSLMYPLAKALRSAQKGIKTQQWATTVEPPSSPADWWRVAMHFPLVVTSSPIYVIDATTEDLRPELVSWARMSRQLKSSTIEGVFEVDVVTFPALDRYVTDRIDNFMSAVTAAVEAAPERFKSPQAK